VRPISRLEKASGERAGHLRSEVAILLAQRFDDWIASGCTLKRSSESVASRERRL
jgi:hypothetical protein